MDDWGERTRRACRFQRPRWKHRRKVFDEGVEHDSRGRLCSPFQNPHSKFRRGNGSRGSAHEGARVVPTRSGWQAVDVENYTRRLACADALRLGTSRAPAKAPARRTMLGDDGNQTCRALPQFAIRNSKLSWLFSCIHFGMDDWGKWRLNVFTA